jgi:hypothetical protein
MRTTVFLFLIASFVVGCRKEKASWDSDWRIPLIQDSLNLNKLVTDSILDINSDGSYHLVINRDLFNLKIDSLLKIPDTAIIQKVAIEIPGINVPPGFSFLNETEEHTFEIADLILKKVLLSKGTADITIASPIGAPTILTLILPKVKKNGIPYSKTITAGAGSIASPSISKEVLDLSGYEIDLTGIDGSSFNILQSQVQVSSDPNGPDVYVSNQDTISFEVFFKDLIPAYARGYFGNQVFSDTSSTNFDILNSIVAGAIDLENVSLKLSINNGLKTAARAKFTTVENDGLGGSTIALSHPDINQWIWLNQATGNWDNLSPSVHELEFTSTNSNIEAFIENIPKFLRFGYSFELNPWGNTSGGYDELFSTSEVYARLTADMPLAIGMNQLTYADTFNLKYDGADASISLKSGEIEIVTSSSYPFDAALQLEFLDATNTTLFSVTGTEKIKGSGLLTNTAPQTIAKSTVKLILTENQVAELSKLEKLVVKAVFDTPQNGAIATIYDGQFIAFKLYTNLKLTNKF